MGTDGPKHSGSFLFLALLEMTALGGALGRGVCSSVLKCLRWQTFSAKETKP